MKKWVIHRAFVLGLMLLGTLLNAGCLGETALSVAANDSYAVDMVFKEFYQALGGRHVLGPAITPLEIHGELQCQFVENALLCYNPNETGAERFFLYPLGRDFGLRDDAQESSLSQSKQARVVDGIAIYEKFLPLYDQLYGARYVGRPLTKLRINQDLNRVEQYFENVGFYQNLSDPNGPVYLIPFGAYLCGGTCSYKLNEYWAIVKSNVVEQPFAATVARLGGPAVFGSPLLKPEIAPDGYLQQVYANTIFYSPAADPAQMVLRPLPRMLGYEEQPLTTPFIHDGLVFYEIKNGLGHNVPKLFDEFIARHGGRDLAGDPISEVVLLERENLYRQCFENYCLVYDPSAAESLRTRMLPLGEEYLKRYPAAQEAQISDPFSSSQIHLIISVDKPNLNANETQVVRMAVQEADSAQPVDRVEASLILKVPNHPTVRLFLPPTGADGMSALVISPQPELENGTRVSYEICLNLPSERPICRSDSYLIWTVQP